MYPANHSHDPLSVLLVDDNRDAADTLEFLLTMWGYWVRVAYSGAQALQSILEAPPDCILLDINMPEMNGYEVARRIRQCHTAENAKIVALTAYSDEANLRKIRESGFDCYLNKLSPLANLQDILAKCRLDKHNHEIVSLLTAVRFAPWIKLDLAEPPLRDGSTCGVLSNHVVELGSILPPKISHLR